MPVVGDDFSVQKERARTGVLKDGRLAVPLGERDGF